MRHPVKILALVVFTPLVAVAGLLLALPYLVNVDAFGGRIVQQMSAGLGRKVTTGAIHLSLIPPSLVVEKLAIGEDHRFGSGDFATFGSLKVGVSLLGLLAGRIDASSVQLEQPVFKIVKNAKGVWNIESLSRVEAAGVNSAGKGAAPSSTRSGVAARSLEIGTLRLHDGTAAIDDLSLRPASHQRLEHIDATVENLALGRTVDFLISAAVGQGKIEVNGKAGPLEMGESAVLPLRATVKLEGADVAKLTGPGAGVKGSLNGTTEIDDDGRVAKVNGTVTVERLSIGPKGRPAGVPVTAKFLGDYGLASETLALKTMTVHVGQSVAQLSGTMNRKNPAASRINLRAENAALAEVGKLLPALGIILPNNSSFAAGVLNNAADFHGSLQPLNGQATLNAQNARLNGFSVGDKIAGVAKLAGIKVNPRDTEIQSLKGVANFVNGATTFRNLELVMPGLTVTGGGNMSAEGNLDMKLQAQLMNAAPGAKLLSLVSGGKPVPFFVKGTVDNPLFLPDVAGLAKNQFNQPANVGKVFGGLFRKKQ